MLARSGVKRVVAAGGGGHVSVHRPISMGNLRCVGEPDRGVHSASVYGPQRLSGHLGAVYVLALVRVTLESLCARRALKCCKCALSCNMLHHPCPTMHAGSSAAPIVWEVAERTTSK
jgi:hypothetical protein